MRNVVEYQMFDIGRMTSESRIDVYPGEKEQLDIVARFDEDQDCYGWNNEAYLHAWRNPKWKLPRKDFTVKVVVTSSGGKCTALCRLSNGADLRLEQAQEGDLLKPFT
jgi:hypothetical protein